MAGIGLALALLVGLSLGILGAGGSIITVPILVYVVGYSAKPAIAAGLLVVAATSFTGAVRHWHAGNVQIRTATIFSLVGMLAAYAGARLATFVTGAFQLTLLALVMLGSSAAMLLRDRRPAAAAAPPIVAEHGSMAMLVPVAVGVGLLTGLAGVGGGFLVVPALVIFAGLRMSQAVGTSLAVIAVNATAGWMGYVGRVPIPWGFITLFALVAIVGVLVGASVVRFIPQRALQRAFAVFLLLVAVLILYENRAVFRYGPAAPEQRAEAAVLARP